MDDTTIAGGIINLSEQNHIHLYQAIKEIWALAGRTGDAAENNTEFAIAMETFLHRLRKENIIRYTLLMTQIRADFNQLYQQMNGMPLREMDKIIYPVCKLCRDHEKAGFTAGVKVGIQLFQEISKK